MKDDQELKLQTEEMSKFARRASAEMGQIVFGAALREYRDFIQETKQSTSACVTTIDVADVLMDQIDRNADLEDDSKEFYKAMTLLAAFQLMGWVDDEFNITVELN